MPTPLAVICSPIHIKNTVPAVKVIAIKRTEKILGSLIAILKPYAIPNAWMKPRRTVPYLVTLVIFFCPSTPSLPHCSSVGTTTLRSCRIMEALMYGVILIAKTENLLKAPPENISSKPKRLPLLNSCSIMLALTPGTGICVPALKTTNMARVKRIFRLSSVT